MISSFEFEFECLTLVKKTENYIIVCKRGSKRLPLISDMPDNDSRNLLMGMGEGEQ